MSQTPYRFVGLDVHKKFVVYCQKEADGSVVCQGKVPATRRALGEWAAQLQGPWIGVLEATMFTGWIYDFLQPFAHEIKVANPQRLEAITTAKKKNDELDASTLADLLRCNLVPECYMLPGRHRELRRVLRYRNFLVREAVRMKNKTACLLMECGAEYSRSRLHGKKYFTELLDSLEEVPPSVISLLRMTRGNLEIFDRGQKCLLRGLEQNPKLRERIERLMTIPGVGVVTALTWVLEVGESSRFRSARKAISYCGLCSGQKSSAGKNKRGPISKQRNGHLQTVLVEAAKLAPRWNPALKALYEKLRTRGNANQATLAIARKLVTYMLSVDKNGKDFELRPTSAA